MSDIDPSEKTEEPTPERRRKARKEGQVPRARDAGAVAASLAVMLYLVAFAPGLAKTLRGFALHCFGEPFDLVGGDPRAVAQQLGQALGAVSLPVAVVAAVTAASVGFLEVGFHPNLDLAAPKWKRLEPVGKLKQIFSPREALQNLALSVGRVAVVAGAAYGVMKGAFPMISRLARAPLSAAVWQVLELALQMALWASLALALLAGLDYLKNWAKHRRDIRMTRRELKDELKQQEGDPRVQARQRAKARELVKRGLAKEVKSADVLVANPEHVAVALRYRPQEGAPVLSARGYNEVAQYMKKLARTHGVPVVENPPLARLLAEKVRPGRMIPAELYAAVAEVLAFVYRLRNRGLRA